MEVPVPSRHVLHDKSIGLSHPAKTTSDGAGGIFIPFTVSFSEEGAWKLQRWATKLIRLLKINLCPFAYSVKLANTLLFNTQYQRLYHRGM